MIDDMEKEAASIRQETIKMCWFMRGGITYNQALYLSPSERDTISKLIKENLETTKKTGLSFF